METIKTDWTLEKCFEQMRFDEKSHLGMGDIRLTIGQQEEICRLVNQFRDESVPTITDEEIKQRANMETGFGAYPDSKNAARDYSAFCQGAEWMRSKVSQPVIDKAKEKNFPSICSRCVNRFRSDLIHMHCNEESNWKNFQYADVIMVIDWDKLRQKFFNECTEYHKDCSFTKVNMAAHDMYEWFKSNIPLVK